MTDLDELLNRAWDEHARTAADLDTSAVLDDARAQVRHRRAVRHSVLSVGGAAAVGVLVWGALAVPSPRHDAPPASPTPTVTTTPPTTPPTSPTPTPDRTSEATSAPTVNGVAGDLPPYRPAPEGLLRSAGRGWVLSLFPVLDAPEPERAEPGDEVGSDEPVWVLRDVLVTSPQGQTYLVHRYDEPVHRVQLAAWSAGSPTAVVVVDDNDGQARADLDLTTGGVERRGPVGSGLRLLGTRADGTEVWQDFSGDTGEVRVHTYRPADGATTSVEAPRRVPMLGVDAELRQAVSLDGDGEDALPVVDLASGARRDVAIGDGLGSCHHSGVLEPGTVLVRCYDGKEGTSVTVWRVPLDGAGAQRLDPEVVAGQEWLERAVAVSAMDGSGGSALVVSAFHDRPTRVWRWDGDEAVALDSPALGAMLTERTMFRSEVVRDGALYLALGEFGNGPSTERVVRISLADGGASELVGRYATTVGLAPQHTVAR